jgi:hypothetical protein
MNYKSLLIYLNNGIYRQVCMLIKIWHPHFSIYQATKSIFALHGCGWQLGSIIKI